MNRSASLYALQQIDSEIDSRAKRLSEIVALIGETPELIAARKLVQDTQKKVTDWKTRQKDKEIQLQGIAQKKRFSEERLYGGKIRNPKELADLQGEIESLDRRKQGIEDVLLDTMMMVEECDSEAQIATQACRQIEAEWETAQSNLRAEKDIQERRLSELRATRQDRLVSIPSADLTIYEQLRDRRGGLAVVLIKGSECQGCMTGVAVTTAREARSGGLAFCGTCRRILYPG